MTEGTQNSTVADRETAGVESRGLIGDGRIAAWLNHNVRSFHSRGAQKVVRGGVWSIGGYAATQFLRTAATLVLARHFLGPETFGTVGLVTVFLSGIMMFSELGIISAVVRHPRGDEAEFLNTALSIQAGRGLAIWLSSMLVAYPLSVFYKQPALLPLLAVAGMSEVVRGFANTAAWTLNRHLQLRRLTLLSITAELVAFGVCMLWAAVAPSAWALVARMLASAVVSMVGSYLITERRARFRWDRVAAKDILQFGGWISLSTAAHFLGSQGERLAIGKLVTPAELGCFSLALMVATVPAAGVGQLINQIFLPMIAETVRNSQVETARKFTAARRVLMGVALLSAGGFVVCAKPLVASALNPKYAMTGWMLQLLGLRVALDLFAAPASSVILAYGTSQYAAAANSSRAVLLVIGLWIAFTLFGLREAVLSLIVAQALSYIPIIVGLTRVLPGVAHTEMRLFGMLVLCLTAAVLWTYAGI